MLCLHVPAGPYVGVTPPQRIIAASFDTLFHTSCRVDGERTRRHSDDGRMVAAGDTESPAIRGFFCLTDTLRPSSPVEQVKVGAQKRERLLGLPVSA